MLPEILGRYVSISLAELWQTYFFRRVGSNLFGSCASGKSVVEAKIVRKGRTYFDMNANLAVTQIDMKIESEKKVKALQSELNFKVYVFSYNLLRTISNHLCLCRQKKLLTSRGNTSVR